MRRSANQRGIFLIFTAIGLVVLLGLVGLAIDSSRQQVVRSELQNAADACALAASSELVGGSTAVDKAIAAGRYLVLNGRNKKNFQGDNIPTASLLMEFNDSLSPAGWSTAGSTASRFVRCTVTESSLINYFVRVLPGGPATSRLQASAIATVHPAQSMCSLPMGACAANPADSSNFGFTMNQIMAVESDLGSGFFRWVESGVVDGAKVTDYSRLLKGSGTCEMPTRSTSCIGFHTGTVSSLIEGWNSRFGMYKSSAPTIADGVADTARFIFRQPSSATMATKVPNNWFTGYFNNSLSFQGAYSDVYTVTTTLDTFRLITSSNAASASNPSTGNWATTWRYSLPPYSESSLFTAPKRRFAQIPILNCSAGASASCTSGNFKLAGIACVLMLSPRRADVSEIYQVAYRGNASDPTSDCFGMGVGTPGGSDAAGPLVPVLVQ